MLRSLPRPPIVIDRSPVLPAEHVNGGGVDAPTAKSAVIMFSSSAPGPAQSPTMDGRRRREPKVAINTQQIPQYEATSPSRYSAFSPTNGTHPHSPYEVYSSRPSTSSAVPMSMSKSPHHAPLPSPKMNGPSHHSAIYVPRDSASATFYDPMSEHREGQASWNPHYHVSSPNQVSLPSYSVRFS